MFFDRTEGNIIQNLQRKGVSKLNAKNIIIDNCYLHKLPEELSRELLKPT